MSVPVELPDGGGDGEALAFDGEWLSCVLSRAFAPGSPVKLSLRLPKGKLALGGKAAGSRRMKDGRFALRLRLISLRRDQREALLRALPG